MKKKLRIITSSFIIALLLVGAFLVSPLGLKTTLNIAKHFIPGELQYGSATGSILNKIHFTQLHYSSKEISLESDSLTMHWKPFSLIKKQLEIENLDTDNTKLNINKTKDSSNNTKSNGIKLLLKKVSAQTFSLSYNKKPITELHQLSLSGEKNKNKVSLNFSTKINTPRQSYLEANIKGTTDDYQVEAQLKSSRSHWIVKGNGNQKEIRFTTADSRLFDGNLTANGYYIFDQRKWYVSADGRKLDLKILSPSLPNSISFRTNSSGKLNNHNPINASLSGSLSNTENNMNFNIQYNGTKHFDAKWTAKLKKLSTVSNLVKGNIISTGQLKRDNNTFTGSGSITGNANYGNYAVKKLDSYWKINNNKGEIQTKSNLISVGKTTFTNITAKLTGDEKKHQTALKFNYQNTAISLQGKGTHAHPQEWNESVTDLHIQQQDLDIKNSKPISINYENGYVKIPQLSLMNHGKKFINLSFQTTPTHTWKTSIRGFNINTNDILKNITDSIKLNSSINLSLSAQGKKTTPTSVTSHIQINKGTLSYVYQGATYSTNIQKIDSNVTFNPIDKLKLSTDLDLTEKNTLTSTVTLNTSTLNKASLKTAKLSGTLNLNFNNLKAFQAASPFFIIQSGTVHSTIKLSGSADMPTGQGNVSLSKGKIFIPSLGIDVQGIKNQITIKNKVAVVNTTANINGDNVNAKTKIKIENSKIQTQTEIIGQHILVANTTKYRIVASPSPLNISYTNKHLSISGQVGISDSKLKLSAFDSSYWLPYNDITFTNGTLSRPTVWYNNFDINIGLNINNNVQVTGYGLDGTVNGSLELIHPPKEKIQLISSDNNQVRGTFKAYGHTLAIDKTSWVKFNGSSNNPTINIKATQVIHPSNINDSSTPSSIIVGINLSGTLQQKHINLYSTPSDLSDQQILSLLLFGYTYNTNESTPSIMNALTALQLAQSGFEDSGGITNFIRKKLQLTEFGIAEENKTDALGNTTTENETPSFVIGRYINKHAYVRYTQDITTDNNPAQIFQLRLLLNRLFSFQLSEKITALNENSTGFNLIYSNTN